MSAMSERDGYDDEYGDDFDDYEDDLPLGPDERDRDLLDGSWERKYYAGRTRPSRDWNAIGIGIALLVLMGLILPTILIAMR